MGHVAGERQEPTHGEAAMAMVMNAFVVSDGAAGEPPAGRDHEEIGLGLVAAVSDRGLRHERNEDAVALATVDTADGPVVISVVCDGVSSADRPDEASLAAVNAAVQTIAAEVAASARSGWRARGRPQCLILCCHTRPCRAHRHRDGPTAHWLNGFDEWRSVAWGVAPRRPAHAAKRGLF